MAKKIKEILVYSASSQLVNSFIEASEKNYSYQSSSLKLCNLMSPLTKAFIYVCDDDASYKSALEKCLVINLPRFIIKILSLYDHSTQSFEDSRISEDIKINFLSVNLNSESSIQRVIEKIVVSLEKGYKLLNFKLNYKGMRALKWTSFICSLLSALLALLLVFTAGIIAISKNNSENRWFANSLLTSGNLTFVMSFVGFYGVKKAGIKEYLKIYSGVLVINSLYKVILLAIYSQLDWHPYVDFMVTPVICSCVVFEVITSCVILLELNVVKTTGTG